MLIVDLDNHESTYLCDKVKYLLHASKKGKLDVEIYEIDAWDYVFETTSRGLFFIKWFHSLNKELNQL